MTGSQGGYGLCSLASGTNVECTDAVFYSPDNDVLNQFLFHKRRWASLAVMEAWSTTLSRTTGSLFMQLEWLGMESFWDR